jgi:DNA repair protein RecO (recombination protein O)
MSDIISTEAVVLKSIKYRETSKIVTFYTRQLGKLSAIAKGARRPRNTFASSLEPMSHVALVVYRKEGREIQTVSECELKGGFRGIPESLEKMAVGMCLIELVNCVAHEEEQNVRLFNLLVHSLTILNHATKNFVNLLYSFEIHLAGILGFGISMKRCVGCGRNLLADSEGYKTVEFHLDKGGPLCDECSGVNGQRVKLSRQVYMILEHIASEADFERLLNLSVERRLQDQVQSFLWSYLKFHVSGIRPLKSKEVFSAVMAAS